MLLAQCAVGVQHQLGADQLGRLALELEHVEQVPVVADVAAESARRGERKVGDAVPGSGLHQLGGVLADLLLGRWRQVLGFGECLAHATYRTGRLRHLTVMLHGVIQEPLDKICIGQNKPSSITIRMLLPDTTRPMVVP